MRSVCDILTEAVNIIERCGWTQGKYGSLYDGYCAVGAISRARYTTNTIGMFSKQPFDAIRLAGGFEGSVDKWNDAPERTKEEVLAVFRKAIDNEKCL